MKTKIALLIVGIIILAIIVPKIIIRDASNLSVEEVICAKRDTHMILENPIERLLIIKTAVNSKEGDLYNTSAYTIAGIKYATVELKCNHGATVTWRRWFEK